MTVDFTTNLKSRDFEIYKFINKELDRQQNQIELIASENIISKAVIEAQGSILTNKYAEGYPKKRYYGGCEFVDEIEQIAIDRVKKLYNCNFANVQPHSGSQANQAVFLALLKPEDTILGLSLADGGHLTHGSSVNLSGKWFKAVSYGVRESDELIDYDQIYNYAKTHKPKLIIGGFSSYSRIMDWKRLREIADEVKAYLLIDMAHISGLIAAGYYPSPFPYADVVTSTTHKTLRGPRGGMILSNNEEIAKKINSAVFPGLQGGPLEHVIAAKAVCFGEALTDEFKQYIKNVIDNSKALAKTIMDAGFHISSNGTDNHLSVVDLRKHNITGKQATEELEEVGITCNKNMVPNDPQSPFVTSGIRIGTACITSRGFMQNEVREVGNWIVEILNSLKEGGR